MQTCRPRNLFGTAQPSRFLTTTSRVCRASKGFGNTESKQPEAPGQATTTSSGGEDAIEALEARMRTRRAKQRAAQESQVKVESAVVDAVQGRTPETPQQKAEGVFVTTMFWLFVIVIVEGLLIAGSGFLPEEADLWVQDSLYPNYTGVMLLFLGFSSLYGLWKIGKVSLPFLGTAPTEETKQ